MTRFVTCAIPLWLRTGLPMLLLPTVTASQQIIASAERAPCFLVPAASRGVEPIEVDAARIPLLRRKVSLDVEHVRLEEALEPSPEALTPSWYSVKSLSAAGQPSYGSVPTASPWRLR